MRPDQLQLGFLKVLKGSYMQEMQQEYELRYKDEPPYEVLSTKWLPYSDVIELKGVEERHKGRIQLAGSESASSEVRCDVCCVIERLLHIACVLHRADKFSKARVLLDRFIGKGEDVDYSIQPTSHFIDCTVLEMVAVGKPRLWVIICASFVFLHGGLVFADPDHRFRIA